MWSTDVFLKGHAKIVKICMVKFNISILNRLTIMGVFFVNTKYIHKHKVVFNNFGKMKHLQPRFVKYLKMYQLICIKESKFRDIAFRQYLFFGNVDSKTWICSNLKIKWKANFSLINLLLLFFGWSIIPNTVV